MLVTVLATFVVILGFIALLIVLFVANGGYGDPQPPYFRVWFRNDSDQQLIAAFQDESDPERGGHWFVVGPHSAGWTLDSSEGGPWKLSIWDGLCKNVVFERQLGSGETDGVIVHEDGSIEFRANQDFPSGSNPLPTEVPFRGELGSPALALPTSVPCSFRLLSASP
ncbi:MAG: hypothetical protein ACRDF7_10495 [Candidatus Limnocylindrales bacterium]